MNPDLTALPYPLLASPKIDGVRCMVQNGILVSRHGKPFRNQGPQRKFFSRPLEGCDGELTLGRPFGDDVLHRTNGCLNSGQSEAYERFMFEGEFHLFDLHVPVVEFDIRYARLHTQMDKLAGRDGDLHVVPQSKIRSVDHLLQYEVKQLARGYEGVMLRACMTGRPYMEKRSTLKEFELVKLKRFEYGKARILAVHPLEHNTNTARTSTGRRSSSKSGMVKDELLMGSVSLEDVTGKFGFSVTLDSTELRSWPGWQTPKQWLNKLVVYKYFPSGVVNTTRHPTCKFRELL
jgi:DNA ligase-1